MGEREEKKKFPRMKPHSCTLTLASLYLHWLDAPQTPKAPREVISQRRMAISITSILLFLAPGIVLGDVLSCSDAELVIYSLTFETHWTRQRFPKQYPEYRPPAHWSKLIGMTHDDHYTLFRLGETASRAIKFFAETGKTDFFVTANHTFDEFYTPSIRTGAGSTDVNFFADGNHTMVSLAVKIIPSPDWFVGVDSLSLCNDGKWVETLAIEANPIDAGTDNGYTFTAPNWETDPPEPITQITSKYPKHPANSFYYPDMDNLPTIATFRIKKKKLYQLVKAKEEEPMSNNEIEATSIFKYKKYKRRRPRYQYERCQLESWSQWSKCNETCGKGFAQRIRKAVIPVSAGKKCRNVTEQRKCSDYTGCYGKHFTWWR